MTSYRPDPGFTTVAGAALDFAGCPVDAAAILTLLTTLTTLTSLNLLTILTMFDQIEAAGAGPAGANDESLRAVAETLGRAGCLAGAPAPDGTGPGAGPGRGGAAVEVAVLSMVQVGCVI